MNCKECGVSMGFSHYAPRETCGNCQRKAEKTQEQKTADEKTRIRLAAAKKFAEQNNISLTEALACITV